MMTVGIDNVRGAQFTELDLPRYKKSCIQDYISHLNDKCFKCGVSNHMASHCGIYKETYLSKREVDKSMSDTIIRRNILIKRSKKIKKRTLKKQYILNFENNPNYNRLRSNKLYK